MKILFLTTILLSKNCNGSEVASQCFIDTLRNIGNQVQVTVVGYQRKGDRFQHNPQETLVVDERYTETSKSKLYAIFWLAFSIWKGLPYSSAKYYSRTYISLVKKLLLNDEYEVIIIDHPQIGWINNFINKEIKLVTIAHNIEYQIYENHWQKASNFMSKLIYQRESCLIKAQEEHLASSAFQIWTLTEHDSKYFSQIGGSSKVRTFGLSPGSLKLPEKALNKCFDIGLLGSWSWQANIEALEWFISDIYPYLPTNLSIHIAGKSADWLTGKYPNIYYRGVVPDAQEFMAEAKVFAIPTLSGGGIQIKTLDAIASGSSIVATTVGMRGISHPPSTVKVANQPEEFANLLVEAIALSSTQESFDEAKHWYRLRQDNFLHDIADALNEL